MAKKEYIERDAALQFVFDACAECMDACEEFDGIYADCNQCMLEGVKLKLRDLPAADVVERKTGKWVIADDGFVVCSLCNNAAEFNPIDRFMKTPYCSLCGARMEG